MKIIKSITSLLLLVAFLAWISSETDYEPKTESNTGESSAEEGPIMLLSVQKTTQKKNPSFHGLSRMDILNSLLPAESKTVNLKTENKPVTLNALPKKKPAKKLQNNENTEFIIAKVTAYCPCFRCCGKFANGRTSTRTNAWRPGIASDPSVIPYGTIITVPGYGTAKVDDTGIAMRRSWSNSRIIHLDIRFQYHWQARNWGTKILNLKIKRPGNSFSSSQ